MTSRAKAVLFDLDGTLFDRDSSFRELVRVQYQAFNAALEEVPCEVFVRRGVEFDEHGYVDKAVVYRRVATEFGLPPTLAERLTAHLQDTYASFCQCFPEVPSAIADLRAHDMKMESTKNGPSA